MTKPTCTIITGLNGSGKNTYKRSIKNELTIENIKIHPQIFSSFKFSHSKHQKK